MTRAKTIQEAKTPKIQLTERKPQSQNKKTRKEMNDSINQRTKIDTGRTQKRMMQRRSTVLNKVTIGDVRSLRIYMFLDPS